MSVEDAERWCDAWEADTASRGLPRTGEYCQLGAVWIVTERAARRPGQLSATIPGPGPQKRAKRHEHCGGH